jgi:2'-5' RNA ligase
MSDLRLFVAIPCPPALQARLRELQESLKASTWDLKVTEPEDLHLTLHFLGATPERVVDDLKRELGAVAHARRPFDLSCGGLGCFPDEAEPRVVYAGIHDPAGKLQDLFEATRRILNAYRLFKLRDELTPHITLARVSKLSAAWDPAILRGLAPQWEKLGGYPVEKMQLMASHLDREAGKRYEVLAEMGMGGQ